MNSLVSIFGLLLSLSMVYGQTTNVCSCSTLDACAATLKTSIPTCQTQCKNQIPTTYGTQTINADAVIQCMTPSAADQAKMETMKTCMRNLGVASCSTGATTSTTNPNNGGTFGGGRFGGRGGGRGGPRGPPALQNFKTCMDTCMRTAAGLSGTSTNNQQQGQGPPGGRKGCPFEKICAEKNNCQLQRPTGNMFQAKQQCDSTGQGKAGHQAKCECLKIAGVIPSTADCTRGPPGGGPPGGGPPGGNNGGGFPDGNGI